MAVTGSYSLCANRVSTRIHLPRKPVKSKPECKSSPLQSETIQIHGEKSPKNGSGRKVMVVASSKEEARAALQWCLSHAVQKDDTLVLLHVVKPYKLGTLPEMVQHQVRRMIPPVERVPRQLSETFLLNQPILSVPPLAIDRPIGRGVLEEEH